MASAWGLPAPGKREGSSNARMGKEVQPIRPILERPHETRSEAIKAVLRRPVRGVFARTTRLVIGPPMSPFKPILTAPPGNTGLPTVACQDVLFGCPALR